MQMKHRPLLFLLLLCNLQTGLAATAQEQSVRPGINDHFRDPNWQQWVNAFERPGRETDSAVLAEGIQRSRSPQVDATFGQRR